MVYCPVSLHGVTPWYMYTISTLSFLENFAYTTVEGLFLVSGTIVIPQLNLEALYACILEE